MEITICSPDIKGLQLIIGALSHKGFDCSDIYSKKRYWLFGSIMYYALLESMTITQPFATGGVTRNDRGEFIVPNGVFIHQGNIDFNFMPGFFKGLDNLSLDAAQAGKDLWKIHQKLNEEAVPSQIQYLEGIERQCVKDQDFERAITIRDRIKSLKNQNK